MWVGYTHACCAARSAYCSTTRARFSHPGTAERDGAGGDWWARRFCRNTYCRQLSPVESTKIRVWIQACSVARRIAVVATAQSTLPVARDFWYRIKGCWLTIEPARNRATSSQQPAGESPSREMSASPGVRIQILVERSTAKRGGATERMYRGRTSEAATGTKVTDQHQFLEVS